MAELHRLAGAPFADRAGFGVVQADQPGRAFGCLPGRPGPGLCHDLACPLDRDRQSRRARTSRPRTRHGRNLLKGIGVAVSGPWAGQG